MKIAAVMAELHIFSDEVSWGHPLRLQICFRDGATLRLRVSGDGEGLSVDQLPLEPPMDMGEAGRTDIFDITDRLDPDLTHQAVGEPLAIRDPGGRLIGLALSRPEGQRFCIPRSAAPSDSNVRFTAKPPVCRKERPEAADVTLGEERKVASQPEIAPPDTIQPQSPPESPLFEPPVEEPGTEPPEIVPDRPDRDEPGGSPPETPPPPD